MFFGIYNKITITRCVIFLLCRFRNIAIDEIYFVFNLKTSLYQSLIKH